MLLLLFIILIIITGLLIIPMILIINILLFEYGMALSCDCVFDCSEPLSWEVHTNRDKQYDGRDIWVLLFYQEECAPRWAKKHVRLFSWWSPAPHPPKEGTLYRWEREVLYLQQRWLFCLYNTVLKPFRTFQKPQSRVSYLPAHLQ